MDKLRADFEKWWQDENYDKQLSNIQGVMFNRIKNGMFAAWQAASNSPETPDGWVSCSERMPEMGSQQCYVLAADFRNHYWPNLPNTQVGVFGDWFSDGNPTWDDGDGNDLHLKEVTHWMPLPEPPKQEK